MFWCFRHVSQLDKPSKRYRNVHADVFVIADEDDNGRRSLGVTRIGTLKLCFCFTVKLVASFFTFCCISYSFSCISVIFFLSLAYQLFSFDSVLL